MAKEATFAVLTTTLAPCIVTMSFANLDDEVTSLSAYQHLADHFSHLPARSDELVYLPSVQRATLGWVGHGKRERNGLRGHRGLQICRFSLEDGPYEVPDLLVVEHGRVPMRLARILAIPMHGYWDQTYRLTLAIT